MDMVVRQELSEKYGFHMIRRLGRGGFAEVWEAHSAEGVACALKISLDPIDDENPAIQTELEQLRLLKLMLGHPHVVGLIDVWKVAGYLVTRWELTSDVEVRSLEDLLIQYQRGGSNGIPLKKLLRYMCEAAEGIDFLNGKGIYHRDIKPSNLLLFWDHVKVADLGLAKFAGASTASHTGAGTLGYVPPEAYGGQLTPTIDLYGLAATYVKLRTGLEPFGNNPKDIIERQSVGRPVLNGLQSAEAALVQQALSPDPAARPKMTVGEWVQAICDAAPAGDAPTRLRLNVSLPSNVSWSPAVLCSIGNYVRDTVWHSAGRFVEITMSVIRPDTPETVIRFDEAAYDAFIQRQYLQAVDNNARHQTSSQWQPNVALPADDTSSMQKDAVTTMLVAAACGAVTTVNGAADEAAAKAEAAIATKTTSPCIYAKPQAFVPARSSPINKYETASNRLGNDNATFGGVFGCLGGIAVGFCHGLAIGGNSGGLIGAIIGAVGGMIVGAFIGDSKNTVEGIAVGGVSGCAGGIPLGFINGILFGDASGDAVVGGIVGGILGAIIGSMVGSIVGDAATGKSKDDVVSIACNLNVQNVAWTILGSVFGLLFGGIIGGRGGTVIGLFFGAIFGTMLGAYVAAAEVCRRESQL